MRICDLTTLWLDGGQGGVNTYLTEKARYYADHPLVTSHTVIVPGRETRSQRLFGTTLHTLESPRLPSNPEHRILNRFRAIRQILRDERPDVIEVDCAYLLGRLVRLWRSLPPVPLVGFYHVHLPTFIAKPSAARFGAAASAVAERLAWKYVNYCVRHLDRLVVPSEDIRRRLSDEGFGRLSVIPLGVNLELFRPAADRTRRNGAGPIEILYVGRLSLEKDLGVLVGAVRLLVERGTDVRLRVVGDGPMRAALEAQAAGLSQIVFEGACPYGADLARHYASADLLANPSPNETFNLTILEAFASGLPVVTARQGGPLGLVDSELGALATPGSPGDFADKIAQVARQRPCPDACRRHVERQYSWSSSLEQMLDVYRTSIDTRAGVAAPLPAS